VYVAYIGTGIWIASIYGSLNVFSFGFWLSSISLLIGFTAVYLLSIQINDEYDLEIDSLSNTGRPLVRKRLQREDYRNINSILVLFAFFAGASLGFEIIFPFLVLSGLSYLYSAPPLRLKRIPLLSNVLLGFGVATVILVGFNFSGIPPYRFPLQTFTILFAIVTLLNLSKDLKDRESDRTTGITTWANYLTKEKSLLIASAALIAAGMLTGIFVNSLLAGLISISIAFFASRLIFKDPSRDISLLVNFILFSGIVTKLLLPYL
jgi:bacteriochlorophyll c synthase